VTNDELLAVDSFWQGPTVAQMEEHGFSRANAEGEYSKPTAGTNIRVGKWGCQWSPSYEATPMSIRLADSISGAVSNFVKVDATFLLIPLLVACLYPF
jgi:hypothetical protein